MHEWWKTALELIADERVVAAIRALLTALAGLVVSKLAAAGVSRAASRYLDTHQRMLLRRGAYYVVLVLFLLSALHQLGFNLSILLGAAGILSVAVGFASQTAASNLISGLFLVAERPFSVGDVITVSGISGEVLSIDLLSIKLRTFDNLYVRIPNEQVLKTEVTTLTKFPIRRLDMQVGVAYKEDIGRVREVLEAVAERNPLCLEEPAPLFIFQGFGDSALNIQFSVWARRESFLDMRNSLFEEVKQAFDTAGIEIPFPHLSLYAGSMTEPLPVRLEGGRERPDAGTD